MKEIITVAVLIATLYGGSILGEMILSSSRQAVHGLSRQSTISRRFQAICL